MRNLTCVRKESDKSSTDLRIPAPKVTKLVGMILGR